MPPAAEPDPPLRVLIGETAAGKTSLALDVAEGVGAEILSMDSMLVYRGMDVGTAKPAPAERARVRHHGLDRVLPHERYDVQRWLADAEAALEDARARGAPVLLVGGTGLYLKALLHGLFQGPAPDPALRAELVARARAEGPEALHTELGARDPAAARRIHPHDEKRLVRALEVWMQTGRTLSDWQEQWGEGGGPSPAPRAARVVGLARSREVLDRRIRDRVRAMLAAGWADEVRGILAGGGFGPSAIQALGYREVIEHVEGRLGGEALEELVATKTRRFARRQRTWFRRFEAEWLDADAFDDREAAAGAARRALGW